MKPTAQPHPQLDLAQLVTQTRQLALVDQIRLIGELAPEIERQLARTRPGMDAAGTATFANLAKAVQDLAVPAKPTPRRSAWGLCADLGRSPSAEEIDAARAELWSGFPRNDI